MKIDQLVYFVSAARHESVGRAAVQSAISPSAISHSIATLEEELGVSLFTRERRRIRLTDSGRLLLERAEKVIRDLSQIKNDLSAEKVGLEGSFRIASTQSLAARFVTAAWSKMQRRHPRLQASLEVIGSRKIAARASASELDLGFVFAPVATAGTSSRALASEPFVVAVRKKHPILKLPILQRAAALARIPCAGPRTFTGRSEFEHPELERLKIRQNVDFVFETYDVAVQRLLHSEAWALIPAAYLKPDGTSEHQVVQVNLPKWSAHHDILAVWPSDRPLGRAMSELCTRVTEECQAKQHPRR